MDNFRLLSASLRVQLVIFGERFRGGQYTLVSFLFAPRCSTWPAICKSGGTPPCPVVPDQHSGNGLSMMVWGQVIWETEVPQFGMESGAPRSQLFVKMGARAPVPHGVDDTVSDILTVNSAGVIHVYKSL